VKEKKKKYRKQIRRCQKYIKGYLGKREDESNKNGFTRLRRLIRKQITGFYG